MTAQPNFTWCDLSTFRPQVTKAFYNRLFDWRFDGAGDYEYAQIGDHQVGAIFVMPQKLQQIGMPSFWMSYASVQDVAATVAKARDLGARIELEDPAYALIRDPLGAGFTFHSGLRPHSATGHGTRAGHAYFCSDLSVVEPFYRELFGWRFEALDGATWRIKTADGTIVAIAYQQPDEIRGKEQYWAVLFNVSDMNVASRTATEAGGSTMELALWDGPAHLVHDPDGAALFLVPS